MQYKRKVILQELDEVKGSVWPLLSFFRAEELKVFQYINDVMQTDTHCSTSIPAMSVAIGMTEREINSALQILETLGILTKEEFDEFTNRGIIFTNLTTLHKMLLNQPIGFGFAIRTVLMKQHKPVSEINAVDISKAQTIFKKWVKPKDSDQK